jgi:hypothetical protein
MASQGAMTGSEPQNVPDARSCDDRREPEESHALKSDEIMIVL